MRHFAYYCKLQSDTNENHMKMQKLLPILLIAFAFQCSQVYAFEPIPVDKLTSEWQFDREIDGVQIFLKKVECNDEVNGIFQEMILLQFVNTTQKDLNLRWDMEFWFNNDCYTCDPSQDKEYSYSLDLDAGAIREGVCASTTPNELRFFVRFLNYDHIPVLTRYALDNFTVTPR